MRSTLLIADREKMLAEVKTRSPQLYPYAVACYKDSNLLFGKGYQLASTRSVQQGDVCGPALFAIALHRVVLQLEDLGLKFQFWYLDDGILCGSVSTLVAAVVICNLGVYVIYPE